MKPGRVQLLRNRKKIARGFEEKELKPANAATLGVLRKKGKEAELAHFQRVGKP